MIHEDLLNHIYEEVDLSNSSLHWALHKGAPYQQPIDATGTRKVGENRIETIVVKNLEMTREFENKGWI